MATLRTPKEQRGHGTTAHFLICPLSLCLYSGHNGQGLHHVPFRVGCAIPSPLQPHTSTRLTFWKVLPISVSKSSLTPHCQQITYTIPSLAFHALYNWIPIYPLRILCFLTSVPWFTPIADCNALLPFPHILLSSPQILLFHEPLPGHQSLYFLFKIHLAIYLPTLPFLHSANFGCFVLFCLSTYYESGIVLLLDSREANIKKSSF